MPLLIVIIILSTSMLSIGITAAREPVDTPPVAIRPDADTQRRLEAVANGSDEQILREIKVVDDIDERGVVVTAERIGSARHRMGEQRDVGKLIDAWSIDNGANFDWGFRISTDPANGNIDSDVCKAVFSFLESNQIEAFGSSNKPEDKWCKVKRSEDFNKWVGIYMSWAHRIFVEGRISVPSWQEVILIRRDIVQQNADTRRWVEDVPIMELQVQLRKEILELQERIDELEAVVRTNVQP